jgi:hypothetical protein
LEDKKRWRWKPPDYRKIKELKHLKKDQLLILLLAGILLLVISLPTEKKGEKQGISQASSPSQGEQNLWDEEAYREALEVHLEELFSRMEGAGEVEVMITLASSSEKIVEKDTNGESETITEEDSAGGNRRTTNIVNDETTVYGGETDQEQPYVSKELTPQVEGVVVLAAGGDDAVVKKNITEAAQALFGIDTHKIRIIKMSEK